MIVSRLRQGYLLGIIALVSVLSFVKADALLSLDQMIVQGGTGLYQYDNPEVILFISNQGNTDALVTEENQLTAGFIDCTMNVSGVFSSNTITNFRINAQTSIQFGITLSSVATQTIGNGTLVCTLRNDPWAVLVSSKTLGVSVIAKPTGRFDMTLERTIDPIEDRLDTPVAELGFGGLKGLIFKLIDQLAIPAAALIGSLLALLALYTILFKNESDDIKKIKGLIVWAILGMVIILSAKYIGKIIYQDIFFAGEVGPDQFNAMTIVSQTYDLIAYPILKIFYYLAIAALFIVLLIRSFKFVSSTQEEIREQAGQIIISTVLGLLTIIGSKQLVEGVYGREEDIRNGSAVTVTDIGSAFLSDANIPIIYTIVQWVMGLAAFAVLAIIVFQTFKMLTDPTKEENLTNIRQTILYVVLGMLVIGAGYLIVNVVMIN